MRILIIFVIGLFAFSNLALAHVDSGPTLSDQIMKTSISLVTLAGILIIILVVLSIARVKKEPEVAEGEPREGTEEIFKWTVFSLIAFISLGTTFYLSASTVYLNMKSQTSGPVHWHADFRIFNCGEEVFLTEPTGLSNRIGKPDLHEHGDGRIHVEGVVVKKSDMSLHRFFEVIGGAFSTGELAFPGKDGNEWMVNGRQCPEGTPEAGKTAMLNVFVYKTEGDVIRQIKLSDPPEYVLSPYSQIPPGDCLIFEYTSEKKNKTDKICNFTSIGISEGRYKYGE